MMTCMEQNIIASWNFWDDDDISTERLLAHVCDDCDCEIDEVIAALKLFSLITKGAEINYEFLQHDLWV